MTPRKITIPMTLSICGVEGVCDVDVYYTENKDDDGFMKVDVVGIRAETTYLEDCFEYGAIQDMEYLIQTEELE